MQLIGADMVPAIRTRITTNFAIDGFDVRGWQEEFRDRRPLRLIT